MNFASLHVHTDLGSTLDGSSSSKEYFQRAADVGITALAVTDHGSLRSHRAHQKAAEGTGIKPILGIEAYFSPTDRFDKRAKKNREAGSNIYNHIVIHAKNEHGLKNLMKLNEESWRDEAFYHKNRIDRELLEKYGDGLIITSACMSGPIASELKEGREESAYRRAEWFRDRFGDDFYIEIMTENGPDLNNQLLTLADELKIKPILTEDAHFAHPDDLWLNEAMKIISTKPKSKLGVKVDKLKGSILDKLNELYPDRTLTFKDFNLHLSGREFRKELMLEQGIDRDDIYDNTLDIADKVEEYPYHTNLNLLPQPKTIDPQRRLYQLCRNGMKDRGLTGKREYEDRLKYELSVIEEKGFASYFLIVSDMIKWAKKNNILIGPGRGSSAGSLVCYVTQIVEVDPIEYGLYFERFLDLERTDWPDIDVDIESSRRSEIQEYLTKKYGYTVGVANIVHYKDKVALKDAASLLKIDFAEATKAMSTVSSFADYEKQELSKAFHKKYPDVLKIAKELVGKVKTTGAHAGALIVTTQPLTDYVAVETGRPTEKSEGDDTDRRWIMAYDKRGAEELGLVKIDALGLKTLEVIHDTFDIIEQRHGKKMDLYDIPLNDPKTYEMLSNGLTRGVFQAEGPTFHEWIVETGVREFNDLVVGTAIARPGAKDTVGKVYRTRMISGGGNPIHPDVEDIMKDTHHLPIYQEHWMAIINKIAGLSMVEANKIRKITAAKKDPELLQEYKERFIDGATEKLSKKQAEKLWKDLEAQSDYSFNLSHAVAYSMMTNATAWLKANYPLEFMYALMANEKSKEKISDFLIEAKRLGVKIKLPHINKSDLTFSIQGDAIRFGLMNIKNIAEKSGSAFIAARPFESYAELKEFVDRKGSGVNTRMLDSLNAIGAASFPENPKRGNEKDNLYEYLGIPSFAEPKRKSKRYRKVIDYDKNGAFAVLVVVKEIVKKDGWARATITDDTGSTGVFFNPNAPIVKGKQYAMLISNNDILSYLDAADLDTVDNALTDYLFTEDHFVTEGFYKVVAGKTKTSKAGKKRMEMVFLDHEDNLVPVTAYGTKYALALGKAIEGTTIHATIGWWEEAEKTTLEAID